MQAILRFGSQKGKNFLAKGHIRLLSQSRSDRNFSKISSHQQRCNYFLFLDFIFDILCLYFKRTVSGEVGMGGLRD